MYIFLSIPILGRPEFKSIYSIYQSILSCKEHKVRLFVNEGDSLISRVRNVHMSLFLEEFKQCDYFVSIDSDLEIVNCFNTNNIFTKLVSHDKEFVGGLYALKQHGSSPKSSSVPLDFSLDRADMPFDKGLIPIRWLSAGCWCLKRSAVEKMVNNYPELNYIGDDNVTGKPIHGLYNPDIFEIEDGASKQTFKKYLSEDWSFPVHPDTPVLCENFIWKKIKDVKIGDVVIGFDENATNGSQKRKIRKTKVENIVTKNLEMIKIVTNSGNELITTNDHKWLIKRSWRKNIGRPSSSDNLTNPMKSTWSQTKDIKIGDYIYKPFEFYNNSKDNNDYNIGYLHGMFDGDGNIYEGKYSYNITLRINDTEPIHYISKYLSTKEIEHTCKIRFGKQNQLRIKCESVDKFLGLYFGRTNKFEEERSEDYICGYLSGIFDAEGNYDGAFISIAQKEFKNIVFNIKACLEKLKIPYKYDNRRFRICGSKNVYRFFSITNPKIKRKMHFNSCKGNDAIILPQFKEKVVSIENMHQNGEMICLVTDSNTFIANGFASHNCERWRKIGGEIYADTSIVLRHIGKFPYSLWNVEVVAKKAEDLPVATTAQKVLGANNQIIKPLTQSVPPSFNNPSIPPVGWDLNIKNKRI